MNKQGFTYLLQHPENISASDTTAIRAILDEFPFFQSAHAVYLKGLKNQESFSYNKALKVTAAHTTDRAVLFDYITSPVFEQNAVSEQIKHQEIHLRNLVIQEPFDVSVQVATEELEKATKILDPDLFVPEITDDTLQLGKPLNFNKEETHSFNEWLKLSRFQTIERSDEKEKLEEDATAHPSKEDQDTKSSSDVEISRKRKQAIIDSFIETNPKIEITTGTTPVKKNLAKEKLIPSEALMTETLARVYICLLYTSPSPRDQRGSRMPSSA